MVDGAEGQAVGPAAAEVGDVNILREQKDGGDAGISQGKRSMLIGWRVKM